MQEKRYGSPDPNKKNNLFLDPVENKSYQYSPGRSADKCKLQIPKFSI